MASGTVLLIEDDQDIQEALKEFLETEGFVPVLAGDGAEGIATLEAGLSPDVILLDLMMPKMGGKEFLAKIKGTSFASVPVIVLTASQELLPEGAAKLVRKPFSLDHLLPVIEQALKLRGQDSHSGSTLADASAGAL